MILSTEAPYSANVREITGPAITLLRSRTLMPASTWGFSVEFASVGANGAGGECDSSLSSENRGSSLIALPFRY